MLRRSFSVPAQFAHYRGSWAARYQQRVIRSTQLASRILQRVSSRLFRGQGANGGAGIRIALVADRASRIVAEEACSCMYRH